MVEEEKWAEEDQLRTTVSKILLQVSDLAEILVYVLLLKVSILILKNILCYEDCDVWHLL